MSSTYRYVSPSLPALWISVLSAVAEIERDNILVQTMEGRKQKAREGKWNGDFAPYGYKLVDGSLFIAEDEVEVIKIIFDKYINTTMGVAAIAAFLNESGYVKKKRQNNTIDGFAASFVKGVIDNPVYCGKLAYGRRKTEKVQGKRNEFHVVKQDEFMVVDGEHEAIISAEEWKAAQDKRKTTGVKRVKTHSLEHEHILTGILKCPGCGANMYGNVNRKRHPKGGTYRDYFYYACKHPTGTTGHKCDYHKQWGQDIVNDAVAELIKKIVTSPDFEKGIREKIAARVDTSELEQELDGLKKKYSDFDVRNYGYSSLSTFIEEIDNFDLQKVNNTVIVRLKEDNGNKKQVTDFAIACVREAGSRGVELAALGQKIHVKYPGFKAKEYGYSTLSKFIREHRLVKDFSLTTDMVW